MVLLTQDFFEKRKIELKEKSENEKKVSSRKLLNHIFETVNKTQLDFKLSSGNNSS